MTERRRRRGAAMGTLGLAAALLVAGGVAAGLLVAPEKTPASLAGAAAATTAPVSTAVFNDKQSIKVDPVVSDSSTLSLGSSGTVTKTTCTPGGTIESGASPVTIDDRPILALATKVPLWRELSRGVKGNDVKAFQAELARLGYEVSADGNFGAGTAAALKKFQSDAGIAKPSGALEPSDVIWLPARTVTVKSCDLRLGASPEGTFATVAGTIDGLRLTDSDAGKAAGERVLALGDVTVPVIADQDVTDPEFLSAVSESMQFLGWQRTDGESALMLDYQLAEPLDVAVIPPGAVFAIKGDQACVASNGVAQPVRVVASSLGQTSVTFDGKTPSTVDLTKQRAGQSC